MALFSGLSERLSHIFSKITKRGKLTELEIKEAMREVRIALLEADVNYVVVKNFIKNVSEKAVGEEVLKSLTPAQQVIKIVNEELTALMGSTNSKLAVSSKPPTIIMMCGLQGAGKTTMCAKLGYYLKKSGKKPLLVACDIYRPAAIDQLKVVGKQAGCEVFEKGMQNPVKTAKQAVDHALKQNLDTVIIDTAGRLHINEELMKELSDIKKELNPTEILLVVDSMTGQDAVTVAQTFNEKLDISGVILTKLDGDTRGGAALSMKSITGQPIKFLGIGEKTDAVEVFDAKRIAGRILGMGDVVGLVETALEKVNQEDALKMAERMMKGQFDMNDMLSQLQQIKNIGDVKGVMMMIPGMAKFREKIEQANIDNRIFKRQEAIILSMTPYERRHPDILKASRKLRIAKGAGVTVNDVNKLVKQYEQMAQAMKKFKKMGPLGSLSAMKSLFGGNSLMNKGGFPPFNM